MLVAIQAPGHFQFVGRPFRRLGKLRHVSVTDGAIKVSASNVLGVRKEGVLRKTIDPIPGNLDKWDEDVSLDPPVQWTHQIALVCPYYLFEFRFAKLFGLSFAARRDSYDFIRPT